MKQLYQDRWFQVFLYCGLIIGFAIGIIILLFSNLELCFTAICFSNILIIFKFPLAVISSGIALAAFRSVMFRSEQAAKQMQELIRKNKFSDFLEHKKEFIRFTSEIESEQEGNLYFANKDVLYSNLFPKNNPQNVVFESDELQNIVHKFNSSIKAMYQLDLDDSESMISIFEDFMWIADELRVIFKITKPLNEDFRTYSKRSYIYREDQYWMIFCILEGISNYCLPVHRTNIEINSLIL